MAASTRTVVSAGLLGAALGAAITFLVMADARPPGTSEAESAPRPVPAEVAGREVNASPSVDVPAPARLESAGGPREGSRTIARLLAEADVALPLRVGARFTGRVYAKDGRPLPGVLVRATTFAPDAFRVRPGVVPVFPDIEAAVRQAVREAKWHDATRREIRTDASGTYVLDDLVDAEYAVSAHAEGYEFRVPQGKWGRARPGATIDFVGTALVPVTIDVLKPDGSPAQEAFIQWSAKRGGGSTMWRRAEPQVWLEAGKWTMYAEHGTDVRSEEAFVNAGQTAEPLTLRLQVRNIVRGTVRLDPADEAWELVWVTLRRRDGGQGPPRPKAMAQPPDWSFRFEDMARGEYELAAGVADAGGHATSARIEVDGPVEHHLLLPRLTAAQVLEVRVTGPGDAPLRAEDLTFTIQERRPGGGARAQGTRSARRADGTFLVAVISPEVTTRERLRDARSRAGGGSGEAEPGADAPQEGPVTTFLQVVLRSGVSREVEFDPGRTARVEVSFR